MRFTPGRAGKFFLVCVAALAFLAHYTSGRAAEKNPGPFRLQWQTFEVGRLGWTGLKSDEARMAHRTNELLSFSSIAVFPGDKPGQFYAVYSPAPGELEGHRNSALRLATINAGDGDVNVSTTRVDSRSFYGKTQARGYASALAMDVKDGENGVELWYVHPFRRKLVRYTPGKDARKTWDLSKRLPIYNKSWHWGGHWLSFFADREKPVVHMSAYKRRAHYLKFNTEKGAFTAEEMVGIPGSSWIMSTAGGIRVFAAGYYRFLRFHAVEEQPKHRAPGADEASWEMTALCPLPLSRRELLSFTDRDKKPHLIYTDDSNRIFHLEPDGKLWRMERVTRFKTVSKPKENMPRPTLSTSAMVSPDGIIHMSCYRPTSGDILHLWRKDGTWHREKVAGAEGVYSTSLLFHNDSLVIVWTEVGQRRVMAAARATGKPSKGAGEPLESIPPAHYLPQGGREVTSLHDAAESGDMKLVKRLVKLGAAVDGRRRGGATPLHVAALQGQQGAAEFLISKGGSVNATDNADRTPLHAAASAGNVDVARLLLEKGAKADTVSQKGRTPLDLAKQSGNDKMIKLLREAGEPRKKKRQPGNVASAGRQDT